MVASVVNQFAVNIQGDAGGEGISRFHFTNGTGSAMSSSEGDSAAAAVMAMYTAIAPLLMGACNYTMQPTFKAIEIDSGLVLSEVVISTVPAVVLGGDPKAAPAGTGARGYWHTGTVIGRRICRGYTYFTTFGADSYDGVGHIAIAATGTVVTAMEGLLAGALAAALQLVIWHRPPKGTLTGGQVAPVIAATCSQTVLSVRSRRS